MQLLIYLVTIFLVCSLHLPSSECLHLKVKTIILDDNEFAISYSFFYCFLFAGKN